ncbi:MAG: hypothetical protein RLZZ385_871 [Pseudomonadota bacterium]|jgi:feruloyl esterase
MTTLRNVLLTCLIAALAHGAQAQTVSDAQRQACEGLVLETDLTLTQARIHTSRNGSAYCYVRGIIAPAIHYHVQLPLPDDWNGRFLMWGDGGKDGDLDFADQRLEQGYAVANSNTGHDTGTEPGSTFGHHNRQSEVDFGHRAVHLTTLAGKTLVSHYYGRNQQYAYFEGCSTGGRQGLMEAQRYPYDFDGIVAGAPVNFYQAMNAAGVWHLQRLFKVGFAGNLAVDANRDGSPESLRLVELLNQKVLGKCDATDGISDGVIDNPFSCAIDVANDLGDLRCPAGQAGDGCFTDAQLQTVADFYRGPHDNQGNRIYPGKLPGSEPDWNNLFIPHAGNSMNPSMLRGPAGDHVNFLFYEDDPGVAIPNLADVEHRARTTGMNPEFHWLEFDVNDVSAGKAALMSEIMDATDPDLSAFLKDNGGKLIIYHGLTDALSVATATVGYFQDVVDSTFAGSLADTTDHARLFLAPGMGHCGGGAGPNDWDKLSSLVDWVENGVAPDAIVATRRSNGAVVNERPLCPWPQQARYIGPAGGANDPANWRAGNFRCE